ncbi:TetR/AcrR family transcriptional regulator [Aeromicrobium alkaliterrae]|uniref:HTH tetR-type domain-containing protein n=1 Tax=Aeromicrobium alkaliterrae TaxID=302168 RepID=A0ABP4VHT6_9ACTN
MTESASSERKRSTQRAISASARDLALEHGLDGFTMDDLATSVGVSRRTLFNYVPGKIDAVLGVAEDPDPELIATFMAGGPTGHLFTDLKELVVVALDEEGTSASEIDAVRRLVLSDPRLYHAMQDRLTSSMDEFAEFINQREGSEVDGLTVALLFKLTVSVLHVALDESLADADHPFTWHYSRVFDAAIAAVERPA